MFTTALPGFLAPDVRGPLWVLGLLLQHRSLLIDLWFGALGRQSLAVTQLLFSFLF